METTLVITSSDGANVRARVFAPLRPLVPRMEEAAASVYLVLPAMGVRASYYESFAEALARAGATVVTVDLRGQGTSSERAAHGDFFGYREIVELDIPAAVSAVRSRFPSRSVVIVGHSLGGQLASLTLTRGELALDGLVLIASGTAHWRGWPRQSRRRTALFVAGVSLVGRLLPWYPGRRLGFAGDQPRELMRDWSRNALSGRYPYESRPRLAGVPILSLEIEGDGIAPHGAASNLLDRFDTAWVERRKISAAGLGGSWERHFAWAKQPAVIVDAVHEWTRSLGVAREIRLDHARTCA